MLEETSKKGIYRGFALKFKEEIDRIVFEWGINHHGNGNMNWEGWATFPSVGKMFHYINITTSGASQRAYVLPKFRYSDHVMDLTQSPFRVYFRNREGMDLFMELVMLEVAEQEEYRKDREEAGVPECITLKFAD